MRIIGVRHNIANIANIANFAAGTRRIRNRGESVPIKQEGWQHIAGIGLSRDKATWGWI